MLVVESDDEKQRSLSGGLARHGHHARGAGTGARAMELHDEADLLLLAMDLPDLDGIEVCRAVRAVSEVPVIVVSPRVSELDCVLALRAGADDYLVAPFGLRELVARIDAVMRRIQVPARPGRCARRVIEQGELRVDIDSREVTLAGRRIAMSPKEFDLLRLLASQPGRVVTRESIMRQIWEGSWSRRTVDTHVSSVRAKLGGRSWIVAVRGVGFKFVRPRGG
ncbi:response regulator transcription factor [Streptomyces xiamenensis]